MPLRLYKLTDGQGAVSDDFSFSSPIIWESSPTGGSIESKFYLRMADANVQYLTNGRLYAQDSAGVDESSWYSFAPHVAGGPGEYESEFLFEIPLGSEIPVWIRVDVPGAIDTEPKDDIRVAASYIEFQIE